MGENRLIIAAAGSGKTTYLVNKALVRSGDVLIMTYTLSNEDVIKRRIVKKARCIPQNITVQTWFSFLLQHGVRPYQDCLHDSLTKQDVRGMLLVNKQSGVKYKNQKGIPVCFSEDTEFMQHYFTKEHKIYSDKISKFAFKCNEKSNNAVIDRLSRIYSHIFIDEVQDLAGYDLELLKLLFASNIFTLLVGDPRQVTYLTHIERKYAKYKNGKIRDFVTNELGKKCVCNIDESTLQVSHRCNQSICSLSSRLYPDLPLTAPCTCCTDDKIEHQGIFLVKQDQIAKYAQRFRPMQLRWDRKTNVLSDVEVMNFGEAKGGTFDRVIIYPTKSMINWIKDNSAKLSNGARAKLYVALTRAKYSVAIVMDCDETPVSDGLKKWEVN